MSGWWERFPGRLDAELEDFRVRGLDFELDQRLFRDAGRVLLRGDLTFGGRRVELEVLYPDLFPYLRPEVFAAGLALPRHQNPAHHNLCLLDRSTRFWRPEDTGAWLVAERVPELLTLFEEGPEAMAAAEMPQGEPVSAYFPRVTGTTILVPAEALALDVELRAGSGRLCFDAEVRPGLVVRALLCELAVRTKARKPRVVAAAADELVRRFGGQRIQMRWARLDGPPASFDAQAIFSAADEVQPGFGRPPWQGVADGEVAVTGVVFPEEVRQGVDEDAWVFGVRVRRTSAGQRHEAAYVIRGDRFTREDLGARIPTTHAMRAATVAQVGLGALGAPLALELARNQAGVLRLLEYDTVEIAQTVRWPFGVEATAQPKLEILARFIERNYPYTRVERFQHRLGQTALERHGRAENEFALVDRFLDGAALVVDASAEIGVQQLHADLARELGLMQVYLSATEGARGGHVTLIAPARGGCWYCWKLHALDGTVPQPPSASEGTVQPRGCASPTFTGASFDLLPITAQAGRVVAAAAADENRLASTLWVCSLPEDGIGPPEWTSHDIAVNPACGFCTPR